MIKTVLAIAPFVDRGGRYWLALYFAATVMSSVLETFGIGMIFVFFQAALDPERLRGLPLVGGMLPAADPFMQSRFIAGVSLVVFLVFLLRTCLQGLVGWMAQDIRRRLHLGFADELLGGYLRQPYVWHLARKPSELYFNVASNTGTVAQNIVIGVVDIGGAATLLLFFVVTLGWLKPVETLVAFALVATVVALYLGAFHGRSLRWGEIVVGAGEASVRAVVEPLRGIKTVKVLGAEQMFERIFHERMAWYLGMFLRQNVAQIVPRLLMELVLVATLLGAVTGGLAYGQTPAEIIPTMALFGAAAYRLVPMAARVAGIVQQFRFSMPAFEAVVADLRAVAQNPARHAPASPQAAAFETLRLAGVSFRYPQSERDAVAKVDLEISKGELLAFVGPSGAGKTTLADILLGLLRPTEGEIRLDGRSVEAMPSGLLGYVPQDPFVAYGSLQKNIVFGSGEKNVDADALRRAVDMAALTDVVQRLPEGLGTTIGEGATGLSGGERQRLGLARALYHDPQILVLDEPTSALDSVTEAKVSAAIRSMRASKTVIVVAHRLSTVRDFDRIVFLKDGRILDIGAFDDLYARLADFRDMVDRLSTESAAQASA